MGKDQSTNNSKQLSVDDFPHFTLTDLAIAFDLKKQTRTLKASPYPFAAFVCDYTEFDDLAEFVYGSRDLNVLFEKNFKVQIAYLDQERSGLRHWSLIEFQYAIEQDKHALKILFLDSLGPQLSYNSAQILSKSVGFDEILAESPNLEIKVYVPNVKLQHSRKGCSMFVMDCASMLSNQDAYGNIYAFMDKQPDMSPQLIEGLNDDFPVHCAALPNRILRVAQSREILSDTQLSQSTQIINTKRNTAKQSIMRHTNLFVDAKSSQYKERNDRVLNKAKVWRQKVDQHYKTKSPSKTDSRIQSLIPYAEQFLDYQTLKNMIS